MVTQPFDFQNAYLLMFVLLWFSKCRKHEADRRTIRVAAPRMGNTEVPPEDGYTWRKYGQKEILGSKYPRYKLVYINLKDQCLIPKRKVKKHSRVFLIIYSNFECYTSDWKFLATNLESPQFLLLQYGLTVKSDLFNRLNSKVLYTRWSSCHHICLVVYHPLNIQHFKYLIP